MYELSFEPSIEYQDAVRTTLGVTPTELTDDEIESIMLAGQAEQELLSMIPGLVAFMAEANEVTTSMQRNQVMIAFANLIAFYAYGPLKLKLLSMESDNKTTAQRFKDAFTRDPNEFKAAAKRSLLQTGLTVSTSDAISLFSVVSPATDVITGA